MVRNGGKKTGKRKHTISFKPVTTKQGYNQRRLTQYTLSCSVNWQGTTRMKPSKIPPLERMLISENDDTSHGQPRAYLQTGAISTVSSARLMRNCDKGQGRRKRENIN